MIDSREFCNLFRNIKDELGCDDNTAATVSLAYVLDKFHSEASYKALARAIGDGVSGMAESLSNMEFSLNQMNGDDYE